MTDCTCAVTPADVDAPQNVPVRTTTALIRTYQILRGNRISPCRYVPSCSHYALEAVERHGVVRGTWLAVRRIARCNPLGRYGFDPVPD